jgi:hypothetical protein
VLLADLDARGKDSLLARRITVVNKTAADQAVHNGNAESVG